MSFLITAIVLGMCLSVMSLGIFLTMRIYNIPDITTDGSYTLGAVTTALALTHGWPPLLAIPVVIVSGGLAGICTGLIITRLQVAPLLAGILVMTALYSINLLCLGRSNVPLLQVTTYFNQVQLIPDALYNNILLSLLFLLAIVGLLSYLLTSDFGIAMRATGNSESMSRAMGVNVHKMKVLGLGLANALTALSGYLVAQYQNFVDINMGMGIVITGLGTVLIGETLIKVLQIRNFAAQLSAIVAGSILFQLVLAVTLMLGVDPNLLKLITSIMVLLIVGIPKLGAKRL